MVISEQEYDFLGNAHGPDVTFFGKDKLPLLDLHKRVQPYTSEITIYPQRQVRLLRLGDTLSTDLLPGFSIRVDELFSSTALEPG